MVNFKVLGTAVLVIVGFFIVVANSLSLGESNTLASVNDPVERIIVGPDLGDPGESYEFRHGHLPLMIKYSNWRPEFGRAYVYGREQDIASLMALDGPLDKMVMTTSYDEVSRLMVQADQLKAAGVTIIGFNTENGSGMTPRGEMNTLDSADPEVNIVARVARLATANGFEVMWGPVRNTVDSLSDEAIRTMMAAGVTGLAIQEQKFIENQPATMRLSAVNRTRSRYLRLAQQEGVEDFTFHVQIMHQRCPNLANCITFVSELEDIPVDSIAIWSNGPIPVQFVEAIRE